MSEIRMFRVNGYDNISGEQLEFYLKIEDDNQHIMFNLGIGGYGICYYPKGAQILTPNENENTRSNFKMISMNNLNKLFEGLQECEWFGNGEDVNFKISVKDGEVKISEISDDNYNSNDEIDEGNDIHDGNDEGEDELYPELLVLKKGSYPSIEIDINYIPEKYQGDWTKAIVELTKKWIDSKNFSKKGTIWMWTTSSVNFHHNVPERSEFIIPMGFPRNFLLFLNSNLKTNFGNDVIRLSDYINSGDEWTTLCHVEDGKVWKNLEGYSYSQV